MAPLFHSCGDGDPFSATVTPKVDSTLAADEEIVIDFSRSVDPSSLTLGGNMSDDSNRRKFTQKNNVNDTLTIWPATFWDTSVPGTLTVDIKDTQGNELDTIELSYKITIKLTTFQAAEIVIGQVNFTAKSVNQGGSANAHTLNQPYGNPGYDSGQLFLSDYYNNRVLIYDSIPVEYNESANLVIGQTSFSTTTFGTSSTKMNGPETTIVHNHKLFVSEYANNRILIYNSIPTTNGASANVVVGQPDLVTGSSGCSSSKFNSPEGFIIVNNKLIVSDSYNHRVLIWNTIPTTNGKAADIVLGQNNFATCQYNDDNQDGSVDATPSARTLNYPAGVWSDGNKLAVIDYNNNRVLIWNSFPATNFKSADIVLGQKDFSHYQPNDADQDGIDDGTANAKTFSYPYMGITSNGTQLLINDYNNHRVMIWNTFPTTNFKSADIVLGQKDFSHHQLNDANQDGIDDGTASAKTFNLPSGLLLVGNQLIVSDAGNSRYLIFNGQ